MMQSRRRMNNDLSEMSFNDEDDYIRNQIYERLRLIESNNKEIHTLLKEHYSNGRSQQQQTQLGLNNFLSSNIMSSNTRVTYFNEEYKRREIIKEIIGVFVSTLVFLAIASTFMQR